MKFATGKTNFLGNGCSGRASSLTFPNGKMSQLTPAATTKNCAAFTLTEVLAALLFLAIVIPTAVEALHVASLAGEVAARKGAATRVARGGAAGSPPGTCEPSLKSTVVGAPASTLMPWPWVVDMTLTA